MTRLLLTRHAPTPETGTLLSGQVPGPSLGPEGTAVASGVASRLVGAGIAAVYSSPINRTWETAMEIGRAIGVRPTSHQGLAEIEFGSWTGRTLDSLRKLKAWQQVQETPSRFRFPNGESFAEAQTRGVAACEEIAATNPKGIVAVVSHADLIKLILSYYLGMPIDSMQRIAIVPASVSVIELEKGRGPRVLAVNTNGDFGAWL